MKSIIYAIALLGYMANTKPQDKEIEINAPLPSEYLAQTESIYMKNEVEYIDAKKRIYSTIGITFVLNPAIKKQAGIKEDEIDGEKVFENDSVELTNIIIEQYQNCFKEHNLIFSPTKEQAEYILSIKVYDHGFHWASSSTAGMFVRTKVELADKSGKTVWEQYYAMNKDEAKVPHDRGAINMNKCIDKLIADYEKDPELLRKTYEQIISFLPPKLFTEVK